MQKWRQEYAKKHPDKFAAKSAKRKSEKLRATPSWANRFFIREAYHLAMLRTKATGIKWHVDHIIPLKHAQVCGLHCEQNLQVVPASYNVEKSNTIIAGEETQAWRTAR